MSAELVDQTKGALAPMPELDRWAQERGVDQAAMRRVALIEARGLKMCPDCHGDLKVKCEDCHGKGFFMYRCLTCHNVHDGGMCAVCDGSTRQTCETCGGQGGVA